MIATATTLAIARGHLIRCTVDAVVSDLRGYELRISY